MRAHPVLCNAHVHNNNNKGHWYNVVSHLVKKILCILQVNILI